jgi:pilus assembly protein CpaE
MRLSHYIFSEKRMYSTAVKMVLDEQNLSNKIIDTLSDLKSALHDAKGAVVIVGPHSGQDPYEICQELALLFPLASVMLLLHKEDIDYKKAMFSGASDVVDIESDEEEVLGSIQKAQKLVQLKLEGDQENKENEKTKVITVCSTKGGVGKTTVSVNMAVAFNKNNLKVAVLDLDLQFGDVALLFDLQPVQTIYDWVKQSFENGDKSFENYVTKHKSGIDIVAAPALPEFAEMITGEHVAYLIDAMKKEYDIVIIDTPPVFVDTSLVALESSDFILLVASMDLPALKNGKLAIETLTLLGLKDKINVIINRDTNIDGINKNVIEDVLGMRVQGSIPSDYPTVISSVNKGIPFVNMAPRTPVAKAIMRISEQLVKEAPIENQRVTKERKKKGVFFFKKMKK